MGKEKNKLEDQIADSKLQQQLAENYTLPRLKVKSKEEALNEILSETTITGPVFVADHFDAQSGVTLMESGKTKANPNPRIHKFNKTGTIRMNKTDYSAKVEKDRALSQLRRTQKLSLKGKRQKRVEDPNKETELASRSQ